MVGCRFRFSSASAVRSTALLSIHFLLISVCLQLGTVAVPDDIVDASAKNVLVTFDNVHVASINPRTLRETPNRAVGIQGKGQSNPMPSQPNPS